MRVPKTYKCPCCGWDIFRVTGPGGKRIELDANLTGYERSAGWSDRLYTKNGVQIMGVKRVPPEEKRDDVDGFGHRPHDMTCPGRRK